MTNPMFRTYSFIYEKFLLAQGSVLVLCTKFNVQIGVVDMLVTHGVTNVWSPPWLYASSAKNKTSFEAKINKIVCNFSYFSQMQRL